MLYTSRTSSQMNTRNESPSVHAPQLRPHSIDEAVAVSCGSYALYLVIRIRPVGSVAYGRTMH